MRIQTDSLKYAKMLVNQGFSSKSAEGLFSTLTKMEIYNIYSIGEVDSMLSEAVMKVFDEQDKKLVEQRRENDMVFEAQDKKLLEQRREFDEKMKFFNEQRREDRSELRNELLASRRWMIGTVITVGLSLAAYLSALLHFNH